MCRIASCPTPAASRGTRAESLPVLRLLQVFLLKHTAILALTPPQLLLTLQQVPLPSGWLTAEQKLQPVLPPLLLLSLNRTSYSHTGANTANTAGALVNPLAPTLNP